MAMKTMKWKLSKSWLLVLALALLVSLSRAETPVRYEAQPGSKVKLDGTSTIHDWTVEGQIIGGFMELESNFPLDPALKTVPSLKVIPKVEVAIPVRSLKSGKTTMDQVMHDAMKQQEHPKIEYRLKEMTPGSEPREAGSPLKFTAKGDLTVAGVTKAIQMPVTMQKLDDRRLKVTGATTIKMTDYGIKPPAPTIGLGLIKTGDEVKIQFEWITAQRAESK